VSVYVTIVLVVAIRCIEVIKLTDENQDSLELMMPAQVARYLGIKERTVYLWAQQGKLPAFKVGSVWRFRRADLERWLESTRSVPTVQDVEPLTPYIGPQRSKWRLRQDEEQAEQALVDACRAYIETTVKTVGREVFLVEQFEDRFGGDVVKTVIDRLKKEKKITEDEHDGLDGEKVKVISERS
jgi:excisionase family DNA binding protein